MILAVCWLGVRRLKGACPLLGHAPGAGVDDYEGICSLAVTESALRTSRKVSGPSVAAPRGFAADRRIGASDDSTGYAGHGAQIIQLGAPEPAT